MGATRPRITPSSRSAHHSTCACFSYTMTVFTLLHLPLLIVASGVLDCLLMSMLGPECRNWYGTMILINKASAAFRNSDPNSKSPKGHSHWSFAPLFRRSHSCLIHPSHSQAKRLLSSQAPDFVGWFLSCGHTISNDQVQFVELYQLARPQVRLQSQEEGDCHKPVLLPCELVRHGRPDWQRIKPARLRWAQAPPSTQASPRSGCGSAPCLGELRNLWHRLAMSHSPTWACSRAKKFSFMYPTRSCTRRARRPPRRPRRIVFLWYWPTTWTPAGSVCTRSSKKLWPGVRSPWTSRYCRNLGLVRLLARQLRLFWRLWTRGRCAGSLRSSSLQAALGFSQHCGYFLQVSYRH